MREEASRETVAKIRSGNCTSRFSVPFANSSTRSCNKQNLHSFTPRSLHALHPSSCSASQTLLVFLLTLLWIFSPHSQRPHLYRRGFVTSLRTKSLPSVTISIPRPRLYLPPLTQFFDGSPLTAFHPVSESSVRKMLNKTAIKTCELDPLPSWLLAELIDDLLLSFTSVINDSLLTGSFPSVFKFAVVRPLLGGGGGGGGGNKTKTYTSLDSENLKNYRPVSNLPFLSKITEKIVPLQLS